MARKKKTTAAKAYVLTVGKSNGLCLTAGLITFIGIALVPAKVLPMRQSFFPDSGNISFFFALRP